MLVAAVLAVGRVAIDVHCPSDVLVGAAVSAWLLFWIPPAQRARWATSPTWPAG